MDATRRREEVYQELLGPFEAVYLPDLERPPEEGEGPEVAVYVFARDLGEGTFYTLTTGGMSDARMHLPPDLPEGIPPRAELLLYVRELREDYVSLLRWLARFPFRDETWLGFGHTVALAEPPFPGSALRHLLLLTSVVSPDRELSQRLIVKDEPVEFLWVVPITEEERDHKIEHGVHALLDLFETHSHPWILDLSRSSYV